MYSYDNFVFLIKSLLKEKKYITITKNSPNIPSTVSWCRRERSVRRNVRRSETERSWTDWWCTLCVVCTVRRSCLPDSVTSHFFVTNAHTQIEFVQLPIITNTCIYNRPYYLFTLLSQWYLHVGLSVLLFVCLYFPYEVSRTRIFRNFTS